MINSEELTTIAVSEYVSAIRTYCSSWLQCVVSQSDPLPITLRCFYSQFIPLCWNHSSTICLPLLSWIACWRNLKNSLAGTHMTFRNFRNCLLLIKILAEFLIFSNFRLIFRNSGRRISNLCPTSKIRLKCYLEWEFSRSWDAFWKVEITTFDIDIGNI